MEYDSVLDQLSISGKNVSLILCVWKLGYMKSGHNLILREESRDLTIIQIACLAASCCSLCSMGW